MSFISDLAHYYDHEADKFHQTRQRHWPEFDVLIDEIKTQYTKKKKLRILELGCGSGRLYGVLQKAFPTKELAYTWVDISEKLIEKARQDYPAITWLVGNMTTYLQMAEQEEYDIVIGIASFHHLPSSNLRVTTANYIYRSLAYDGFCFFTNRSDSERFRTKFRSSIIQARWKTIVSFGIYKPSDLFLPWKNEWHSKVFYRYYHIFSPKELEDIAKISWFGDIQQFYLTSEWERTNNKKISRNLCSIRKKNVFLGE